MALKGKIDVFKKTWPWGRSKEDEEAEAFANMQADPGLAAQQLSAMFKGRLAREKQSRKKT